MLCDTITDNHLRLRINRRVAMTLHISTCMVVEPGLRHRSGLMDPKAIQALVGCSSRQYQWIERIWRPDPRALRAPERTVARGMEGWQHQFNTATHASDVKHGAPLAIVERIELDEVDSGDLGLRDVQEGGTVDDEVAVRGVYRVELVDKKERPTSW